MNPYFAENAGRAEKVRALFDVVADRYDFLNDVLSLGLHRVWKRRLVELANIGPSSRALDVCCGTGDVAIVLADTGAQVVGVDFSTRMLDIAKKRLRGRRRPCPGTLTYLHADALRLPFRDECFDVVTISYGLRNLASVEAGLSELVRVTKQGGRVLVLDFGKPESGLIRACYEFFLRRVVPLLGKLSRGGPNAYAYIATSLDHYPAQRGVTELMRKAKLKNVVVQNILWGTMSIHCAEKHERDFPCSQERPKPPSAQSAQ